jgi:hypothetical protein
VQAICDQQRRITWMSTVACGSTHDVQALERSWLGEHVFLNPEHPFNKSGFVVFGDAAYRGIANRCKSLITPYDGNVVSVAEDNFNYFHSSSRMSVEGCFGEFCQRWGVLWRPLRVKEEHAPLLLSALGKLHNLCVDGGPRGPPETFTRCTGPIAGDCDMPIEMYTAIAPDGTPIRSCAYPDDNIHDRYFDGAGNRSLGRHQVGPGEVEQPCRAEMCEALEQASMHHPSTSEFSYRNRIGIW